VLQPIGSTRRTIKANGVSIQERGKSTITGSKIYGLGMLSGVSRRVKVRSECLTKKVTFEGWLGSDGSEVL
jgi:hypothetical protein